MQESANLLNKLKKYKSDILNIDSSIKEVFFETAYLLFNADSTINDDNGFYQKFFNGTSPASIAAFLTKLQNSIKVFENRTVAFCNNKIGSTTDYIISYSAIVGQNAQIIKNGNH